MPFEVVIAGTVCRKQITLRRLKFGKIRVYHEVDVGHSVELLKQILTKEIIPTILAGFNQITGELCTRNIKGDISGFLLFH